MVSILLEAKRSAGSRGYCPFACFALAWPNPLTETVGDKEIRKMRGGEKIQADEYVSAMPAMGLALLWFVLLIKG